MISSKAYASIRPFHPDDLLLLPLREQERGFWHGWDMYSVALSKLQHPARTLLLDNQPLVCYGITFAPWESLGSLWSFFSADVWRHRYLVWKALSDEFGRVWSDFPTLRRLETLTLDGDDAAARVVSHLGFLLFGHKPYWGPGGVTMLEWAILRE